jgi:hypothetical protein
MLNVEWLAAGVIPVPSSVGLVNGQICRREPQAGDAYRDTQPAEEMDNNKLATIYYDTQVHTSTIHW